MRLEVARRTRAQAPFLAVLAIVLAVVAYLIVNPGHWRRGTGVIGAAMLLAGLLRLVLPRRRAGLLAARRRYTDVACYAVLGALILIVDLRLRN